MAGDSITVEAELKAVGVVVVDILASEIDRDLYSHRHRIIDEHEALQCLVALLIGR